MAKEASEDKAQTPSGMKGIPEGIRQLVAESETSPEKKKEVSAEGEKEPCETCDEEKGAKEAPKVRFYIKDAETGQEIPAVFKSEGKEHIPDSVDKILTWTGMGIHANRRLEEIKGYEPFVKELIKAKEEGRLIIKDGKLSSPSDAEKVESEEPEEDETLTDPAVIAERKKRQVLEGHVKELKETVDSLKAFIINTKTAEMKKEIESEIGKFSKTYPFGGKRPKEVWRLLAEVGEDGVPTHTVESAMKKVHEDSSGELKAWAREHPEFIDIDTKKLQQEGIQKYLEEKEEREKHPVSSPSGVPAGGGETKTGIEVKGLADIGPAIKELLASSTEAGKKS